MATIAEALSIAVDHHQSGRIDEAETLYRRILDADPDQSGALYFLGILLAQTGRIPDAEPLVARATLNQPGVAEYHATLGKLHQALGRTAEAAASHRRAVALQPEASGGYALAGGALQALGATDEAIATLCHAATLAPDDAETRQRLALLLQLRGVQRIEAQRPQQAVADLTRAAALGPVSADLLFQLGNAHARSARPEAAMDCYAKAITLQPDHTGAAFNRGVLARTQGRLDDAIRALRTALHLAPDYLDAREELAVALFLDDRRADAAEQGNAILSLKKRQARADAEALHLPPLPAQPSAPQRRTRNVMAFSLWGAKDLYLRGAVENARLTPAVYPGWICRVYHDDSVPPAVLHELAALGADLVAMEPGSGPVSGLYWRFLASDDPEIARFVCRDCDSRIGAREKAAVDAWIASGLPFHVMRDHILHTELMLAGMWGGMAGLLPSMAPRIAEAASSEANRWQDQRFLQSHVWPVIEHACLVHDSVQPNHGQPFPPGTEPHAVGRRILLDS